MRVQIKGIEKLYQIFLEEGEQLTTEQIATHCKISKKTLFNRYQSRQNLENQVVEYWKHCFYTTFKAKMKYANNQIEGLLYFVDQLKKSITEEQVFFRLEEKKYLKPAFLQDNFFVHIVEYLIREGIREGFFKSKIDPTTYAIGIIFNLFHLFYYPDNLENTINHFQLDKDQSLKYISNLIYMLLTSEGIKLFEMISIDQFLGITSSCE